MKKSLAILPVAAFAVAALLGAASSTVRAADAYPAKPIQLIVPFAAGGGTDAVGRILAESMKNVLKQDVVVVNKIGGAGAVGMNEGLRAKPDGYTVTMVTREVSSLPLLGQAPFKTLDFKFVGNVNSDPAVVTVSTDSPYKTIEDLMAAMKATPGKLKFAASAAPNFYALQFSLETGLSFITVPFQGAAPAMIEILGGRADFGIYNPGEIKAQVEAGKLRALAVMAEKRVDGMKDTPTFKEKGLNVVAGTFRGLAVPPQTPEAVVKVLETALAQAVKETRFVDFMKSSFLGIDYRNSDDFLKLVEADMKALKPVADAINKK